MKTPALDLQQEVTDELEFDPSVSASDIGVSSSQGIVTLSGHVGTYAERYAAEKATLRVAGVRGVANEIVVRLPGADERTDEEIATAALAAINWDATIPKNHVKVTVAAGRVVLTGELDWHFQRYAAERDVRHLRGVRSVINQTTIKPKVSTVIVKDKIQSALLRSAEVDASKINVSTKDNMVTLAGTVRTWAEKVDAARAAWSVPGVASVENHISVSG